MSNENETAASEVPRRAFAEDAATMAEISFRRWCLDAPLWLDPGELPAKRYRELFATYLAGWRARPRVVVLNAATDEDASKLALAVAVAQEAAILLELASCRDADARALNLGNGPSRLGTVVDAWWKKCGYRADDMSAWLADAGAQIHRVLQGAPSADHQGSRLVHVAQGTPAEVDAIYAAAGAPRLAPADDESLVAVTAATSSVVVGYLKILPDEPPAAFRAAVADLIDRARDGGPQVREAVAELWASLAGETPEGPDNAEGSIQVLADRLELGPEVTSAEVVAVALDRLGLGGLSEEEEPAAGIIAGSEYLAAHDELGEQAAEALGAKPPVLVRHWEECWTASDGILIGSGETEAAARNDLALRQAAPPARGGEEA